MIVTILCHMNGIVCVSFLQTLANDPFAPVIYDEYPDYVHELAIVCDRRSVIYGVVHSIWIDV